MNRAERRSIREALKKRTKVYHCSRWSGFGNQPQRVGELPSQYRYIDTPTPCSCMCCGNQRKFFGETLPERKARQDFKEQLKDAGIV